MTRVSNSLDSDQDQHFVGPDLGSNFLQRVISRWQMSTLAREELNMHHQIESYTDMKQDLQELHAEFHWNSKTQFHDFPWFLHDQQYKFHDSLMDGLQSPILEASSPLWV